MELPQPHPLDRRIVGEPSTCHACGEVGVVERFDLVLERQGERCSRCETRWWTPFDELALTS